MNSDYLSVLGTETRLSQMDDDELVRRQLYMFAEDKDFRDKYTDFERALVLYSRKSSDNNGPNPGIPWRNLIKRAVDERHGVSITNIPRTKLKAVFTTPTSSTYVERFIAAVAGQQAERTLNSHVDSILRANNYTMNRLHALKQAAIYGVGYVKVAVDKSGDTRLSPQLRQLMQKPLFDWTDDDSALYVFLMNRITTSHVNTPDVYWQHGIRRVDETMVRVSVVERGDVQTLRRLYDNELICPGKFPHELNEDPTNDGTITAVLTTWELEPITVEKTLEDDQGNVHMSVEVNDWIMVKTVIAGGQLVEKSIIGNFEDEEAGIEKGAVCLPIVPFYLETSEEHPYGFSIPLQMEVSEEFINRMYLIMYKSARKAASNQGIIINASLLGEGDIVKIQQMLDDGGAAVIRGNDKQSHNPDLSKVVVPLNPYNGQLPSSVIEAVRNEEAAFREQSGAIDLGGISRARSGSAKRAQVTATDRPKTAQITHVSLSEKAVYGAVYSLVQTYHDQYILVPVEMPGQNPKMVPLNMKVTRILPVLDDSGSPVFNEAFADQETAGPLYNPAGVAMSEVEFVVNSTSLNMIPISDGDGELPHDPVQRVQILSAIHGIAPMEPETLRELLLPREVKEIDDAYRSKRMANEAQLQQMLAAAQPQGQQQGDGSTFPAMNEVPSLGTLIQDVQSDQQKGQNELANDQLRLGLPVQG